MIVAFALAAATVAAPAAPRAELVPGARYDARIPTLQQVAGHDFGEEISTPDQITTYLRALAAAAPDRTRLVEYARSWEGRPLHVLVIGAPERMARLDAVKADLGRLADPRGLSAAEADRLVAALPAVTLLIHAVHGNEISSSEAALAEAYHLLAAQDDAEADLVLRESLVLIDPLQNPDGRARFIAQNELGRAATPDPEPVSIEHDEPWPGGRGNHYLFDMNRDYFARSQPETQGRLALYLQYFPQVVVDLHEMGGESTYYFAPPAEPANPYITAGQRRWFETFGRANADRFDSRGFAYFVREVYDSFYPGYGESWPIFQGAIGMTYEQASPRGLVYRRQDDTVLTYRDAVVQHFTAALQTAVTAARGRERLLRDYLDYRRSAVAEGGSREYLLVPGVDPSRAERLARVLAAQGIEVRRAAGEVRSGTRTLPAGTYLVAAAQPSGRLVRNLLDPAVELDSEFVKEQERRRSRRLDDEIYDVTAWSLPLAFDVEVVIADQPTGARAEPLPVEPAAGAPAVPAARVAYFMPWGSGTAAAVASLLRVGVKVRTASEPFTSAGRRFEAGTAIVRVAENGPDLLARLGAAAAANGVSVVPADSGWVEQGISLGSGRVRVLRPPRVVLAWDVPAQSLSAGWARYVLERRFGIPVTAVRTASLPRLRLDRYDVVVLPSGDYDGRISEEMVGRLREWMRTGGTLVTLADASRWAARTKVGLLETRTELKGGRPEIDPTGDEEEKPEVKEPKSPFDLEQAIQPERERPATTAGAFVHVELDREHWLTAGHDADLTALVEGNRIFTPIRLDQGRNAGLYAPRERLVASGLMWDEVQAQLARKAFLIHQPMGAGHLVAFAEDPNFRAYTEATMLLLANAVLLGPAH